MFDNLLLVTLTDLMHHPRDHSPQLDLAPFPQLNFPIIRPASREEALHTFYMVLQARSLPEALGHS